MIKTLKKNDKSLFAKRQKGFYGRVFVLGYNGHHIVLQHIKGKDRHHAVLTYCDTDLFQEVNEKEALVHAIQRHYLKKYNKELLFIKSSVSLPQFSEKDGAHWLELAPVGNQTAIDFGKEDDEKCTGSTKIETGLHGADARGTCGTVRPELAKDMRDRKRQPKKAKEVNTVGAMLQLGLELA